MGAISSGANRSALRHNPLAEQTRGTHPQGSSELGDSLDGADLSERLRIELLVLCESHSQNEGGREPASEIQLDLVERS